MTKKETADFTLLFKADGTVELLDARNHTVWSSDNDDEFTEEFGNDMFSDEEDSEDILDYLNEHDFVNVDTDEIDIVENDLADESNDDNDGDDVIDGEFTEH